MAKLTISYIKEEFNKKGYTLLSDEYINNCKDLKIKCDKGHVYYAPWRRFVSGHGCPYCAGHKITIEEIQRFLVKRGETLLTKEYINNKQKLQIKCKNNHIYESPWTTLQKNHGCPYCAGNKIEEKDVFEQIDRTGYKVISSIYKNNKEKIEIMCDKWHKYQVTWSNFKKGKRCPMCNSMFSKAEKEILQELKIFENNILENSREIIAPKEIDIYFPEKKLAIEYCGLFWHSDKRLKNNYHREKLDFCINKEIRLITIFEDEWLNQREIVLSKIKQALGNTENKIYARKTEIKETTSTEANDFYRKTHLQGSTKASYNLGLYFENELVACISVGKPTRNHTCKNTLEIKRYSTKLNTSIVGGFSKLFKQILKYAKGNFETIRSHNDLRWGKYENSIYEVMGFKKVFETRYTPHYVKNGKRFRNFSLRKTLDERLIGKKERELREEQGYTRIFDCGHQTWDYIL